MNTIHYNIMLWIQNPNPLLPGYPPLIRHYERITCMPPMIIAKFALSVYTVRGGGGDGVFLK